MSAKELRRVVFTSALLLWAGMILSPVVRSAEAWAQIQHPELDFLFVDVMEDLPVFNAFSLDPVSVWHPDNANTQAVDELKSRAKNQLSKALAESGLTPANTVGEGVLVVHVELIDLKSAPVGDNVLQWAERFRFEVAPGRLTLVAELRDGATGRVVARLADLEQPSSGASDLWNSIDLALSSWGQTIAGTIDRVPGEALARAH